MFGATLHQQQNYKAFFPVTYKCLGYFLFRGFALDVSRTGKFLWGTFTCENGFNDTYVGFSRNVEQDKRKFYVYLLHSFLHGQDYT